MEMEGSTESLLTHRVLLHEPSGSELGSLLGTVGVFSQGSCLSSGVGPNHFTRCSKGEKPEIPEVTLCLQDVARRWGCVQALYSLTKCQSLKRPQEISTLTLL